MEKKYYLGLDMGTDSVGWAVTDEHYNLMRAKGKDLWGVREFEEAHAAAERRSFRISRRRRQREQVRIGLLKDYFKDEIDKVDPAFYQRLQNSFFQKEDKPEEFAIRIFSLMMKTIRIKITISNSQLFFI